MHLADSLASIATQAIREHIFPGCVIGVVTKKDRLVLPFGRYTYDAGSQSVSEKTIYDVASVTKAIPVSSLALQLLDEQKIKLLDRVISYIPEIQNTDREQITLWHLLTQTLDFSFQLSLHKDKTPDEILSLIFTTELRSPPGTVYDYANATSVLLGMVIERVLHQSLDQAARERFFIPLDMDRTTFHSEQFAKEAIAPTEIDPWRGRTIQGEVHDEITSKLMQKQVVGSAGLFSTVPDLLNFLTLLLSNGVYKNRHYFSESMLDRMRTNQLVTIGKSVGLGWELNQVYMGKFADYNTIAKTGFTGCHVLCCMEKGVGIVLLSNHIYPKRSVDRTSLINVRRNIADTVFTYYTN
ncbi:MAG: beta-lactamase family protein [Candidatus Levybacteria bacterium]|nr:beta-lactamase family protein [Candidatus Levybacteria bacterium]